MKPIDIKTLIAAMIVCFSVSTSQAQTEPRLVLPIGHTESINSAVFSPDGKYVLTASNDNTARIFEVSSGKEVHILTGHKSWVSSAVFSPDNGKYALTASGDSTARIWDVSNGKELHILSGHTDVVLSAVFSMDGKFVLTASADRTARIWEVAGGKELHILSGQNKVVNNAVFSPEGKFALTAGKEVIARIFDVTTGNLLQELSGHNSRINSAVFSRDGDYILTASSDKTARIYEVPSGKELHILTGHKDQVSSAVFSPDEKYALTASKDNSARIFEVSSGKEVHILTGHKAWVSTAVFSPNGKYVITASGDSTARIWEVSSGKELHTLSGHTDDVNSAVFSPDGKYALTASNDNTARIWEVSSGKELHTLSGYTVWGCSEGISCDGKYALTASSDNKARIWDVGSCKEKQILMGHSKRIANAIFSSDMSYALTSSFDNTARIYSVSSGKVVHILSGHTDWVTSAVFSPNGKLALTASWDQTARIYEVATGKVLHILACHKARVNSAVFSPNGKFALTASEDSTACIWEVSSGKVLHILHGHTDVVKSAVFSPDGKYALTSSEDNTARIWEVSGGKEVHILLGHTDWVSSIVFSSDGKLALTASWDQTARIYEVATGKELHILAGHKSWVSSAVFSPDNGKYVLTASGDSTSRIWEVSSGKELHILSGHKKWISSAVFSPDGNTILTMSADHKTILWETATGKSLYTRLQLKDNDWLVCDEHYRFDGTPGAIEKLYFTCGLEVIELGQMKDALYVPGLASKIMNGEDINYKKLSDLDICGALPLIEKNKESSEGWEFSIEKRRWDITRLEIKVDGKTVKTIFPDQLKFVNAKANLLITLREMLPFLIEGETNSISLVAITESDNQEFISRGVELELEAEGDKQAPNFYMLMIGVNDYKDDALDLRFPVQDARAFGSALESSARKLLGDNKVFVYNVQSKTENNTVYTTPERVGIMKALEEIGKKAKTNDVLFIFFAGHGVMQGADNSFTFLTADASKLNPVGISTTDLKSWLSPEGPFHMMPNKTVLVYDACNSGQASKELADLAMARDDNATERQRQIEDLGDKSGVFILSASAPNQSAYELPHLGQGMLTYSLLTTLKNNPGVLDESQNGNGFLNLQKWFLETEREQSRLMQSLGLNQDAQPYGTANIRIGIVDDEVREGINLMAEKPLVYCTSARDDSEEDPLELKQAVNAFLETATSRGTTNKLGFIKSETSQANILKLVYSKNGDTIECRILIFKNKLKINEININTSITKAAEDVVKAVEGVIK